MTENVLISICIPAYKNTSFLKRLLDSIVIQTFKDYEVIITDDSPDETVKDFISNYPELNRIRYYRNKIPLGTPENWNESIRRASGKWIKLMHDDDWFVGADSLQVYAEGARKNTSGFIFSAYNNVFIDTGRKERVTPSRQRMRLMEKNPYSLFSRNIIGPPSVTLHRNDQRFYYDPKTKWVVDIDFYIRILAVEKVEYIDRPLINVGMSDKQVTVDCVGNRKIQVPENFYLLKKVSGRTLNNLFIYDAWWRLIRNLEITNESHIREAGYGEAIQPVILSMIHTQKRIPRFLLTQGVFSKISMFVHYLLHRNKISS